MLFFYRTTENDGLYAPPRFQTRQADGIRDQHIGDVIGLSSVMADTPEYHCIYHEFVFLRGGIHP